MTTRRRGIRRTLTTLAAATLALAGSVTVAAAPPAEAAAVSSWSPGVIYQHYGGGGQSQSIAMPDYGPCDLAGYTLNVSGFWVYPWDAVISSVRTWPTWKAGCNKVTIYMRTNPSTSWSCNAACMRANPIINFGGGFNDNVSKIRWSAGG